MWDFIDKVIYINLDHRADRRKNMMKFFTESEIPLDKVIRFSAINEKPGIIGAVKSHIAALKTALSNNWETVLILEDDCVFVNSSDGRRQLKSLSETNYDVIMFGGHYNRISGNRIYDSWQSHAYIIGKDYMPTLISNFETGLQLLSFKPLMTPTKRIFMIKHDHVHHFDVYWCSLQVTDKWMAINPPLVNQIESYSDINNG